MKLTLALLILSSAPASAETRIFIAKPLSMNLLRGDLSGLHAAQAYCKAKGFVSPVHYRTINPTEYGEIYNSVVYVEIKCEREAQWTSKKEAPN